MKKTLQILILDDSLSDTILISKYLIKNGFTTPALIADDAISFKKLLNENVIDVILCDHVLPTYNSLKAFTFVKEKYPNIVFIVISGHISEEFACELLNEGIDDYILKENMFRLSHAIENAYLKHMYYENSKNLLNKNNELKNAYEIMELKNKTVRESIVFAERIQELTLPKIDLLSKNFSEAFVFYKPKDIIGGDFYWFSNRNGNFIAVMGDCSGHGISGALLVMIASNLLNEIIENENNFNSPSDILSLLDVSFCKILQQEKNGGYQDGIDLGLVSIDKNNNKIYFCGCKRSLLFLAKKENEIITYRGEPYLIGGIDNITKTFKTQEIDYQTGDIIYMYTDGYVDQFGGDNNKKFMKNKFIEQLLSFNHLDLKYQHQLLEQKLINWQGNYEQTDDILVVGIKL